MIDITDLYDGEVGTIINLIADYRLKEALTQIQAMAASSNNWKLKSEIETLKTSYELMLDYDKKGYKDPNLSEQYTKFICRTYELMDWARIEKDDQHTSKIYNKTRRLFIDKPSHSFEEIRFGLESYTEDMATVSVLYPEKERQTKEIASINKRHEEYLNELFEKVWTSPLWNNETEAAITELLHSVIIPVNDICVLISAVTMATMHWFDIRKYLFLVNAYQHKDEMVKQRAIVGIALLSNFYHTRIVLYPQAKFTLKELKDNPSFVKNLHTIQMQILLTRMTDKIDYKLKNEIIPRVMKNYQDPKIFPENMLDEDGAKPNPEWDSWLKDDEIMKELNTIEEWQKAGADLYMGSFAFLKKYPFFKKISHWFYPFDFNYTGKDSNEQIAEDSDSLFIKLMLNSELFCDSDKYSIFFNLLDAPFNMQKEMLEQFKEQSEELSEEQKEMLSEKTLYNKGAQQISRHYIHDIYRFYKLSEYRKEEFDVFANPINLWENEDLKEMFDDEAVNKKIADFLLDNGYYSESFLLFEKLSQTNNTNIEYYQKCGYALERMRRFQMALNKYKEADILMPNEPWTLQRMAMCNMKLLQIEEALEYYKRAEKLKPDDLRIAMDIGRCLLEMGHFEEALPHFFKVEYLSKKPKDAQRAIGWCYFNIGKYEEAKKYYDIVLQDNDTIMQDWLNAAHLLLVLNQTEEAISYYKKAIKKCKDFDEFVSYYHQDIEFLIKQGVSEEKTKFLPDELL